MHFPPSHLFLRKPSPIHSTFPCKSYFQNNLTLLLISFQLHPNCWNCSWSALPKIAQNAAAEASAALEIAKIIRACISHTPHFLIHPGMRNAFLQHHHVVDSYLVWNALEPSYPFLQSCCLVKASSYYIDILWFTFVVGST